MVSRPATSRAANGAAASRAAGSEPISRLAPAKINLYLHVLGRRPDGYHLLDSLFAFADFGDEIDVSPSSGGIRLTVEGPFAHDLPESGDNLVVKGAEALAEFAKRKSPSQTRAGADIRLIKSLPVAAGIGGGSADAAAALHALNAFWEVGANPDELATLAGRLGADVPACLHEMPVQASGIGDHIRPAVDLPDCAVVLVNPRVSLLTADAFKAFAATTRYSDAAPLGEAPKTATDLARALTARRNDLEAVVIHLVPAIATILGRLRRTPDCLLARLSGSGPTCFGLFADREAASSAAKIIAKEQSGWWVKSGGIRTRPAASPRIVARTAGS